MARRILRKVQLQKSDELLELLNFAVGILVHIPASANQPIFELIKRTVVRK